MQRRAILIVDDDADIRESLKEVLSDEGYEVHTVADGREALAVLPTFERPPLILLDLLMPTMNGWEVLEALQAQNSDAIAVVFSAAADAAKVLESGARDFVAKPMKLEQVLQIAERYAR
jgi:CheY-like chemotaxis protein